MLVLSGCGGEDTPEPTSTDAASVEASPEPSPSPTEAPEAEETEPSDETEEPSDSAPDPGPAPSGAVIAGGAAQSFPDQVGEWVVADGSSGPATLYSVDNGPFLSASFLSGSDYASISAEVSKKETPAGTGVCGLNSGGTSNVCYLETADGVVSLAADSASVPLADVVVFANQLTAELGVA